MADGPYLAHYFGPGPMHETFKMRVFTLHGPETFETYTYLIDSGFLMLYQARLADNNKDVRLDLTAAFAPGGWLGYALDEDSKQRGLPPVGFEFRKEQSS